MPSMSLLKSLPIPCAHPGRVTSMNWHESLAAARANARLGEDREHGLECWQAVGMFPSVSLRCLIAKIAVKASQGSRDVMDVTAAAMVIGTGALPAA